MKAVIQRVKQASVTIDDALQAQIGKGLLVLVGITHSDKQADVEWLAHKVVNLRIFDDDEKIMNRSVLDVEGDILIVSQFTLQAALITGNRPSYMHAASPERAQPIYDAFCAETAKQFGKPVGTGIFGADMQVALLNDGPVTLIIDTKKD